MACPLPTHIRKGRPQTITLGFFFDLTADRFRKTLSVKIVKEGPKGAMRQAKETGASILATGCPRCQAAFTGPPVLRIKAVSGRPT